MALRVLPSHADWRTWEGRALCALGKCAQARKSFAGALRADNRNVWALVGLGVCLERSGQAGKAVSVFARARRLAPDLFAAK
jgi:Flp pilus assembly protein TadD